MERENGEMRFDSNFVGVMVTFTKDTPFQKGYGSRNTSSRNALRSLPSVNEPYPNGNKTIYLNTIGYHSFRSHHSANL